MKKFFKFILKSLLIILLLAGSYFGTAGYMKYYNALKECPLPDKIAEIQAQSNYTLLSDIPETFKNAMVSVEDRRFYKHHGFDYIGTARAIATDIRYLKPLEGGSTITQQLAKNIYFPQDGTPSRKIAEILMALKIEREYEKDDILELYFNVIYYGKGCYNIHDAAKKYFNKAPSDMTKYESTLLAGIPNAPSVYSNNSELAAKRQKKVLESMVRSEYISEDDADEILNG